MKRLIGALLVAGLALFAAFSSARATTAATTTPRCKTGALELWLGVGTGGAGAGSTVYPLEFTNESNQRCHLFGFPGVSAQRAGHQVGSAADRDHAVAARTVTLAPRGTAHAQLRITNASVIAGCKPVTAEGLSVFPPGAVSAADVPFRFKACSAVGKPFLSVQVVQPRVGVPGH
jgi:hypothetical protein